MKFSKVLKAMLRKVDHWSTVNETQDEVASEMTSEPNSNTSLAEHREILSASIAHERRLPIYSASNTYALQLSNFEESPSDSPTSNIGMIGNILNDPTGLDWVSDYLYSVEYILIKTNRVYGIAIFKGAAILLMHRLRYILLIRTFLFRQLDLSPIWTAVDDH